MMGSKERITPYILTGVNYVITWNPKDRDLVNIEATGLTKKEVHDLAEWLLEWAEKSEKGG
jgi:hypothetical protein